MSNKSFSLLIKDSQGSAFHTFDKRILNVGTEQSHDLKIKSAQSGLYFTIHFDGEKATILPSASNPIQYNGRLLNTTVSLKDFDKLEWNDGQVIFTTAANALTKAPSDAKKLEPLDLLLKISSDLQSPGGLFEGIEHVLDYAVSLLGCESACLMAEVDEANCWEVLSLRSTQPAARKMNKKDFFSQTILSHVIESKKPMVLDSLIGHPWAKAESVIASSVYSIACIPLLLSERIFGALFLFNQTPGKSFSKDHIQNLGPLVSIASTLLLSQLYLQRSRRRVQWLKSQPASHTKSLIVGPSSKMKDLTLKIEKIGPTPLHVLIQGETGAGKELIARELHEKSSRHEKPFVAINCASIPETLLESTLFGHEKGAFTGATKSQIGKFEHASGGTLFLDEIGDLPLALQAKILRVIQEQKVEPVGSLHSRPIDIRLISATHVDLEKAVQSGSFRKDLYFRLNGVTIEIPPLRERKEDIAVLAQHFIKKTGSSKIISSDALLALQKHSWPGNVRELEQCITRAIFLSDSTEILAKDLDFGSEELESLDPFESLSEVGNLKDVQKELTRRYAQMVLDRCGNNRLEASLKLGISERSLYRIFSDSSDNTH